MLIGQTKPRKYIEPGITDGPNGNSKIKKPECNAWNKAQKWESNQSM